MSFTVCPHSKHALSPTFPSSSLQARPGPGALLATESEKNHSRASSISTRFTSRVASNLAAPAEETRKERIFLGFLFPTPSPPRRRIAVLVLVEILGIGAAAATAATTATVPAITLPTRLGIRVRDERQGLQEGTKRRWSWGPRMR